jgi:hypothetical protein
MSSSDATSNLANFLPQYLIKYIQENATTDSTSSIVNRKKINAVVFFLGTKSLYILNKSLHSLELLIVLGQDKKINGKRRFYTMCFEKYLFKHSF